MYYIMEYNKKGKYNPVTMQYEYEPELDEITDDPFEDMRNRIFSPNERKKINEYKGARAMQKTFRGYSKRKNYPKLLKEYKNNLKKQQEMSAKKKKIKKQISNERQNMLERQKSYDAKYAYNEEPIIHEQEYIPSKSRKRITSSKSRKRITPSKSRKRITKFIKPIKKSELEFTNEKDENMFAPYSSAKLNRFPLPKKSKKSYWLFGGKNKTKKNVKGGIHEIIIPTLLVGANNLSKKKRKSNKKNKTKSKK